MYINSRPVTALAIASILLASASTSFVSAAQNPNASDLMKEKPALEGAAADIDAPYDFCDPEAVNARFKAIFNREHVREEAMQKAGKRETVQQAEATVTQHLSDDGQLNSSPPYLDEFEQAWKQKDVAVQQELFAKMTPFTQARAAETKRDWGQAIGILTPLADEGGVDAQDELAMLYSHEGTPLAKIARQSLLEHPELKIPWAPFDPPENEVLALKYFTLAAAQGNAGSQYGLANAYACGQGTQKDYVRAYAWLSIVLSQQAISLQTSDYPKETLQKRDFIALQMSYEQIQQAKKLILHCYSSHYKSCEINGS